MRRILSGYLQIPIHSLSCVFSLPSHFFGMLIQFTNRRKTNHAKSPMNECYYSSREEKLIFYLSILLPSAHNLPS